MNLLWIFWINRTSGPFGELGFLFSVFWFNYLCKWTPGPLHWYQSRVNGCYWLRHFVSYCAWHRYGFWPPLILSATLRGISLWFLSPYPVSVVLVLLPLPKTSATAKRHLDSTSSSNSSDSGVSISPCLCSIVPFRPYSGVFCRAVRTLSALRRALSCRPYPVRAPACSVLVQAPVDIFRASIGGIGPVWSRPLKGSRLFPSIPITASENSSSMSTTIRGSDNNDIQPDSRMNTENGEYDKAEEIIHDQSPVEEVALTVPTTDDPTVPVMTFRMWVLGLASCALLSFFNQFFSYRNNQLVITAVSAQIAVLPLGHLMAATLPRKKVYFPKTHWQFSLNPGPFNIKEHVLITIFANAGSQGVYAIGIITILKTFYKREPSTFAALLLTLTTQMLGFGWAGIFRKFLVEASYMWWPLNLVQISLFRALHEKDTRSKGGLTRFQFFIVVITISFAYYIVPGFLFPSLSAFSIACLIWRKSVTAQQIGSGLRGLGLGSFGLDWATVSGFLGGPLATPWFATANIMIGFAVLMYVIVPISYWTNLYNAKTFPIYSKNTFADDGQPYNVSRVLTDKFAFDKEAYRDYSKLNLSITFVFTYALSFATLGATVSHVLVFHGKEIWRQTKATLTDERIDVHTRLMRKNYEAVPQYWFLVLLALMIGLSILACEGFHKQLQLPWWGVLLACALAFSFTLPIGVINATTNQQVGLNVITEYIIGYLYPGKPAANVAFKTYGYISMSQALQFLQDFKLGHYMKIPPRSMFVAQVAGTIVSGLVYFGTAMWLLGSVKDICHEELLPADSPWTCPGIDVFYSASIIWGVIGPQRMFGNLGLYEKQNWAFLAGAALPVLVWVLGKSFPKAKWIKYINFPVIFAGTSVLPPARAVNYICWGTVGFVFNFVIYRRYKGWWSRHNYIMSGALDAGLAFMAILSYFALTVKEGTNSVGWWGGIANDHCPLAACPIAPGVVVEGCPVH